MTPDLIEPLLVACSGSPALPQIESPVGGSLQDSSEIIVHFERAHTSTSVIPDTATRPKQRLAPYLIELLSDAWLIVSACRERSFYSENGLEPSDRAFNEHQWETIFGAGGNGPARRAAGAAFFEAAFGISDTVGNCRGPYAGLIQLSCTKATEGAWRASLHRLLQALEVHFGERYTYLEAGSSRADGGTQRFCGRDEQVVGDGLPRKTFTVTPGFEKMQTGKGPLAIEFEIEGILEQPLVVPN